MKKNYFIVGILIIVLILLGTYYMFDKIQRDKCYNMPINRYVEDKMCEKYTWKQYMNEHYGK